MDPIENILHRLNGVKETKPDQWVAICPSHSDRNPSLAIKRGDDGRVLLKCWAGCGAADIVEASGLELKDLFEQPIKWHKSSRERLYPNYKNILKLTRHDLGIILIVTMDIHKSRNISDEAMGIFIRAYANLEKIMEASYV